MNLQPLIDNLPMILAALGLLLWAAARLVEAKAKANPTVDAWDKWAPRLQWASQLYSQALDWLVDSGSIKLNGKEKLAELNRLLKEFQTQIDNGDYKGAIAAVVGYYVDAKGKAGTISANPLITRDTPAQE